MPARLRPTASIAPGAILVGDPGRALMLAQELLVEPKMSNHARGLWGYTGATATGRPLTVQSTGMGGPSAGVVVRDLAELGVRRAIRIGTCASLGDLTLGELLLVGEAQTPGGVHSTPEPSLTQALARELDEPTRGMVVSLDSLHRPEAQLPTMLAAGADMQTATLLETGAALGVAVAAVLVVVEKSDSGQLRDEELEAAAKRAGIAAAAAVST
jgi:uridine phosphorylase